MEKPGVLQSMGLQSRTQLSDSTTATTVSIPPLRGSVCINGNNLY